MDVYTKKKRDVLNAVAEGNEGYCKLREERDMAAEVFQTAVGSMTPQQRSAVYDYLTASAKLQEQMLELACIYMDFKPHEQGRFCVI